MFIPIQAKALALQLNILRGIQKEFLDKYGVNDIWSNSKIYEIIIANQLGHILIPGHSGSKDAKDKAGFIYEYKHFKESSSNHTWTFNDYSDTTIEELAKIKSVIFAHVDDTASVITFDWYYEVPGKAVAAHLKNITLRSTNHRKMWNVSVRQIESDMGFIKKSTDLKSAGAGIYYADLKKIFDAIASLEKHTGVTNLLTSNKLWELIVAAELSHNVNSEQGGRAGAHDAFDTAGNTYEYKVAKNHSWQFQDISENVLNKYLTDKAIILAVVNKTNMEVECIYTAEPGAVVKLLRQKLDIKIKSKKPLRRLQVSLTKGDLARIAAVLYCDPKTHTQ